MRSYPGEDAAAELPRASADFALYTSKLGLEASDNAWAAIIYNSCLAAAEGSGDRWLPSSGHGLSDDDWFYLADRVFAAAVILECPYADYHFAPEEREAVEDVSDWVLARPQVPSRPSNEDYAPPTPGSGYLVMCTDGTWSGAGGRQGACSHHGGVSG